MYNYTVNELNAKITYICNGTDKGWKLTDKVYCDKKLTNLTFSQYINACRSLKASKEPSNK